MSGPGPRAKGPPDWDARYRAAAGGLYGETPNEYLRMIAGRSDFAPRSALMLADGDGRNGTWLAARGLAVTAIDISAVATARAAERDRLAGVNVERIAADLGQWTPPAGRQWDAAFLFYLQCEEEVRQRAMAQAIAALAPGGWFVLEAFARTDPPRPGLGPERPGPRYGLGEIEAVAEGLHLVEALAGRVRLDEGAMHRGEADIIRFAARKPI